MLLVSSQLALDLGRTSDVNNLECVCVCLWVRGACSPIGTPLSTRY